jgi:hypothetical protein
MNLQEVNGTVILPLLVFPELAIVITLAPNCNPDHSFPIKLDNLKREMLEKVGNELVFPFRFIFLSFVLKKAFPAKLYVCGAYMSESTGGQWYSDTPPLVFLDLTSSLHLLRIVTQTILFE